jgi:hypothetical protein
MESLEIDLEVMKDAFSGSVLVTLLSSSSDSSIRPSSRSMGEPDSDDGISESSCFHSCISSSMEMVLSVVERCRRRAGILGMVVTASKAATAGGSALASWPGAERADELRLLLRILAVCVEEEDFKGVRGGMPTGLDIAVEAGTWAEDGGCGDGDGDDGGGGDGNLWSGVDLFIDCVEESTLTGLEGCKGRLDRKRVPILSDFGLEERGEGGECCR